MDLWTGPLARASRLSAKGAHLWMAGWTTLRVAHAPTHRPSAAHKLHRAPPLQVERSKTNKTKPLDSHWHQAHIHGHHGGPQHPQIDSITTIKPAQPSTRPKSVTFPKSPVTFAEIRITEGVAAISVPSRTCGVAKVSPPKHPVCSAVGVARLDNHRCECAMAGVLVRSAIRRLGLGPTGPCDGT